MKLFLSVETPADDDFHYPRIAVALNEYTIQVKKNNEDGLRASFVRGSELGCDMTKDGRNIFVASNGVIVTEALEMKFLDRAKP